MILFAGLLNTDGAYTILTVPWQVFAVCSVAPVGGGGRADGPPLAASVV